ncbi:MAG TPA: radical SAM protein [Thermodesulfobacteriota bacterium]|nr:radical SAM protein [Thermodesulfobacteriota bacterium]
MKMTNTGGIVLSHTTSVCPHCLKRIDACHHVRGGRVYLEKVCPEHGSFRTIVWDEAENFSSWKAPVGLSSPARTQTKIEQGCPFDCGLCPDHLQKTCCVLLEVTSRCDLRCPICFADSAVQTQVDPPLSTIREWYEILSDRGGPYNVQLSGGEPCLRDDLPSIVELGRAKGFPFIQINTNGLRLSHDKSFLKALKQGGASTIFLQFDGTQAEIHRRLRGRDLLDQKKRAIDHCAEQEIGVVLVSTLVPGVNEHDLGALIRFSLEQLPAVRGVHFQPISYLGRYPSVPNDSDRITIPEVLRRLENQTEGLLQQKHFKPSRGTNSYCSFYAHYVVMPDGKLLPLTKRASDDCCGCGQESKGEGSIRARDFVSRSWRYGAALQESPTTSSVSLGGWDMFLERFQNYSFCVSGMAFQDAWNLDLARLKECYVHVMSPEGHLVPFCSYYLTSAQGRSLYQGKQGNQK